VIENKNEIATNLVFYHWFACNRLQLVNHAKPVKTRQ